MPAAPLPLRITIASWLLGVGLFALLFALSRPSPSRDQLIPAPHQVPTIAGGTSLRLAMIHDVFIERGERRSRAWHAARLAKRQTTIAGYAHRPADGMLWEAYDDAAVSLDALKRFDEGIVLLREKLALLAPHLPSAETVDTTLAALFASDATMRLRLFARTLEENDLHAYRTFANLATLLAHGAIADSDNRTAYLTEARLWLGRALAIHPGAHFGREMWQWVALDSVLAWQQDEELMHRFDLFGRALDVEAIDTPGVLVSGPSHHAAWRYLRIGDRIDSTHEHRLPLGERARIRRTITSYAPDPSWIAATDSRFQHPIPFDEPALALIGMWWFGGGPNPFSAVTLASICESIGQHVLAWEGYARARFELSQRPKSPALTRIDAFAAQRQAHLVTVLGLSAADMEATFASALAEALAEQERWHHYEAAMLADGADVDNPAWLDAWRNQRATVTTRPGLEDWFMGRVNSNNADRTIVIQILSALLATVMGVYILRSWARWRYARRPPSSA